MCHEDTSSNFTPFSCIFLILSGQDSQFRASFTTKNDLMEIADALQMFLLVEMICKMSFY